MREARRTSLARLPRTGSLEVLIDGIGCKTLIPFGRLSRLVNRYAKRRQIERLLATVDRMMAQLAARRASTADATPTSITV